MKKKELYFIKAGIVAIIALAFVMPGSAVLTKPLVNTPDETLIKTTNNQPIRAVVFQDSFETYEDFVVDNFPPWTTYDGDQGATWGVEGYDWPNVGYVGSFMIFNPAETTPPITEYPAHTGLKYATCWDAVTASAPNDDWLFTPKLSADTFDEVVFWARSLNDAYGLERFAVGVSTTDTDPASFTIISPGTYVEAPITWTQFSYDISSYTGQDIYVAINVVSYDAFAFFLDDFQVTGTGGIQPLVADAGGPYTGDVGEEIQFTGSATGGVAPYTWAWDFGNGDTSTVQNPMYAYDAAGDFTVTLTVTDSATTTDEDTATATIVCNIEMSVAGGLGLKATVKNNGTGNVSNLAWSIVCDGGFVFPKNKNGTITTIAPGAETTIKMFLFGFGKTTITIQAGCAEKTIVATVFLIFVKI